MNLLEQLFDKLYLKQWSIGVTYSNFQDIIRHKKSNIDFNWIPLNNKNKFYADPFLLKSRNNEISILFEEYDYEDQYGKISLFTLGSDFKIKELKTMIDTQSHLSYPNIFIEEDEIFVFPESCKSGRLSAYKYNNDTKAVSFISDIIDLPLVDSTLLKFKNKYWIFSTMDGENANEKLYIHYSESLLGPYIAHSQNPVKNDIYGTRPAGNFFEVDGQLYRPAQNSGKYYGSSISINKVIYLSEHEFQEELYMTIAPNKKEFYNFGMHTVNHLDNVLVVDGLVRRFLPFRQLITFIRKHFIKRIQ